MSLDIKLDHLEELFEVPSDDRCEVRTHERCGEACSVTARWACYGTAECSPSGVTPVRWCDVRYARWLKSIEYGGHCHCGLPVTHWTVVPL